MTTPSQRQQLSPHYATLTAAAEDHIRRMIAVAPTADARAAENHRNFAFGVLLFWNQLTTGWQQDGDYERLEALIDAGDYDRLETAP